MKRFILILLFIFISLFGYKVIGYVWHNVEISIPVAPGGFNNPNYYTAISNCVNIWNAFLYQPPYFVPIRFQYMNTPPYNGGWSRRFFGDSPLMMTGHRWLGGQSYKYDSTWVEISDLSLTNYHWDLEGNPNSNEYDFRTAFKHEMGHMGGLYDEPAYNNVIMYPYLGRGETREIALDDERGMVCLYEDLNYPPDTVPWEYNVFIREDSAVYHCQVNIEIGECRNGLNFKDTVDIYITYDNGQNWEPVFSGLSVPRYRVFPVHFCEGTGGPTAQIKVVFRKTGATRYTKKFRTYYRIPPCLPCGIENKEIIAKNDCPCSSFLGLNVEDINNEYVYSLFDISGRVIMRNKKGKEIIRFIKDNLINGTFFLRKEFPGEKNVQRLVILK